MREVWRLAARPVKHVAFVGHGRAVAYQLLSIVGRKKGFENPPF
jgi:hypothetical protein